MDRLIRAGLVAGIVLAAGCSVPQKAETPPPSPASSPAAWCQPKAAAGPGVMTLANWAQGARLLEGLGSYHRAVTTKSEDAQRYFDQGFRLVYAFNHDEATRAFVKAAELDPGCASCWWGAALTLGPNYNIPMLPDRAQAAWDALQRAQATAAGASPVEQALVRALAQRYPGPTPLDPAAMQPHQQAFAKAMGEVAQRFPEDLDVQTLYAEALMTANPWKLWTAEGQPAAGTPEIVAILERVLAKNPEHPGANHYYIHAVEASKQPQRALAAAHRIGRLMPAAGHLVHMPAHIYQRVGRYADAARANRGGAEADLAYIAQVTPPGYYPMYLAHNYDFLSYSAAMQGRSAEALAAARDAGSAAPSAVVEAMPGMDFFLAKHYLALLRFGRWDTLLAEPEPPDNHRVQVALYRFAQAYAQAAKGQQTEAEAGLAELQTLAAAVPADLGAGLNSARDVMAIAVDLLTARIALGRGQTGEALERLRSAVAREDALAYDEPADWYFPARHLLGAALLQVRQPREAEAVYRADLQRHPENGWALFGLWQSLAAQRKKTEAAKVRQRFETAWAQADVTLAASAY